MKTTGPTRVARLLAAALPVLTLALAGCPVTQPQDTPVQEFQRTEAVTGARYWMYVPSYYDAAKTWPVMVSFHGTHGFDGPRTQAREWKALAEEHGFIVVAPSLASPQGILPISRSAMLKDLDEDERKVLAILKDVKGKFTVDERAVAVTGFSAGGYPLYYIGLRNTHVFSVLVARSCNCDLETLKTIPITDKMLAMPILVTYGKTGINPIYSKFNPVANQSWEAFKHLRLQGCAKAKIKSLEGGHNRRPDVAYDFWQDHQPQLNDRARLKQ